jgi:hypothetical protein
MIGEMLYKIMNQVPGETYNFAEQTLMLDICLGIASGEQLNVEALKKGVKELSPQLKDIDDDKQFNPIRDQLKTRSLVEVKVAAKPVKSAEAIAAEAKPEDKKDEKKEDKKDEKKPEEKPPEEKK